MNCHIIKDLIPLYIDTCCSKESAQAVEDHIRTCHECKALLDEMNAPVDIAVATDTPKPFHKLKEWHASLLQSVLLFLSFALITVGVALEAQTPSGLSNGLWAFQLVIPATGFLLSLANWYFIKLYKSKRQFSLCSLLFTFVITMGAYAWAAFHYGSYTYLSFFNVPALLIVAAFCAASLFLSAWYAVMIGKE